MADDDRVAAALRRAKEVDAPDADHCAGCRAIKDRAVLAAEVKRWRGIAGRYSDDVDALAENLKTWEALLAAERAKVERVRDVLRDLNDPNPEADQDWYDDPVGCIRDALRSALDGEQGADQ